MNNRDFINLDFTKSKLYPKDFVEIKKILSKSTAPDFIFWLYDTHPDRTSADVMLGTIEQWASISAAESEEIMQALGRSNEVGLLNFICFMGKFIGVDFRKDLDKILPQARTFILESMGTADSPLFYFDDQFDGEIMRRLAVKIDTVLSIKSRLISEGVPEARSRKPRVFGI